MSDGRVDSSERNRELVRTVVGLWKQNRVAEARQFFHDDARLIEPESLPYGGVHVGYDEILLALRKVVQYLDTANAQEHFWVAGGDQVIGLLTSTLRLGGEPVDMPIMERWQVRDGKVEAIQAFYFDTARLCDGLNERTS